MQVSISEEWVKEIWCVQTMECCSATQRNGVPVHTTTYFVPWNEPWQYYAPWNKPDTRGKILYDSTYMRDLKKTSSQTESRMVVSKAEGREKWRVINNCIETALLLGMMKSSGSGQLWSSWIYFMPLKCVAKIVRLTLCILNHNFFLSKNIFPNGSGI